MTRRRFYSVLILLMMILTAFCAGGCGGGSGGTAGTPPEQPPTPNPDPTPIVSPDPVPIPVPPPVDSPDPTPTQYTVTFDSNGGSPVASITVSSGGTIEMPDEPTREGYVFAGWYKDSEFREMFTFGVDGDKVTGDITLYAKWDMSDSSRAETALSKISIVFQDGDSLNHVTGNLTLPTSIDGIDISWSSDKPAVISNSGVVTRPKDSDVTVALTATATVISTATTFTASASRTRTFTAIVVHEASAPTPVQYTVTFNSNGGSSVVSVKVSSGGTIDKPTDPTRTGYTFSGWFKDTALSNPFTFGSNGDKITDNTTLYAKWAVNSYTVAFNSNGGSDVGSISANYGSSIDKPTDPTRTGYSFSGWFKDSGLSSPFTFGDNGDKITDNTTLYAKWTVNTYTVSFNSNGGSAVGSISANHGSTISKPADPTRTGYTFSGWFKDTALSIAFTFGSAGDKITDNIMLYAKWTVNSYTVTFNSNGGSAVNSISANHGSTIDKPDDPTRIGYTFSGWFKDSALSNPFSFGNNGNKITDDTTLYAKWTANSYTVSFNSNGGSAVSSISAKYGSTIDAPTNPTRSGYSFAGWFKDSAFTNPFTFGSAGDKITDNITLHVKWTVNTYTVSFNSNGGSAVGSVSASYGYTINKPVDPTRTGYSFAGWFKDSELSSPFTFGSGGDKITDNTTLYAKWTVNSYTVAFNSNGGSAVSSISANYGATIDKPADPIRAGYSFAGWFKDSAFTNPFTFGSAGDKITDNITLHAKWTVNTYTVSFNSNGGSAVGSISANHGSTISKPADPTRTGYSFAGWFKDSALSAPFSFGSNGDKITDNITLYAKWTVNSYTVSFNSNGGSSVGSISANHGSTINKPTDPTRIGYSFAGWFKDAALSNSFTFGSNGDKITDNITLYAKWTVNSYTVSFNSNGGSAVGSISVNHGSTINKPTDPARTGYTFAGWFKDSALSAPFTFGANGDKITDNITLYAKWTVNSYTVAFNSNGGSAVGSVSANYGSNISKPTDPTRTGYYFAGWFKDSALSVPFTFGSAGDKITDNITLYAKWNVNSYTVSFNSNGGSAVASVSANYGSTINKPTDPTRTGYSFAGWFKDSALSGPFTFGANGDKITDNITLHAKWTVNSYTVSFNSNGGSATGSISVNHGATINKPTDPTRTGYSFAGWFKDSALTDPFTFGDNGDKITYNITLYAKWTVNSYTVSFNSNGGSAVNPISANHGSTINKPDDPTRTGYSFAGWFKDSALSNPFSFGNNGDRIIDNITLYAKWTVNTYTITFKSNGGSAVGSIPANHGATISKPDDPTRTGYSFSGWFKDSALSAPFTFGSGGDKITDNITLYAKWTQNSYAVSFNSNGGSAVGSISANYGSTINKPADPTRTGYSFSGWFKDSELSSPFTFGDNGDKITGNIILYAKWTQNSYTVTFNSNGGSAVSSISANHGSTINKPADPTRTGYSFAGWFKDSALSTTFTFGSAGDKITDNIMLYAKWTQNSYTVSFNSNGGSAIGSISASHGSTINKPADPTRTGYSFAGWFKDSALSAPFTFGSNGDKITDNITLYAKWTINSYTVAFNSNGGSTVGSISANHGSTINKPADPTRSGYSFAGWFKDSALSTPFTFGNNGDKITDNITLYAKWTVNSYTVAFNSNGGSAVSSISVNHDSTINKPTDPTRTGYTFSGWFKDTALSNPFTFGADGDKITDNITLYAKWTVNSYTVSFNSNGGSTVGSISATHGNTINKPADPTRTGYTFSGWFKDVVLSNPFTFGSNGDTIIDNTTLYAKWTVNSYTVSFNSNGGSAVSSISANHGATIDKPADPTRTGYSFAGWFKDSGLSSPFTFGSNGDKITYNTTLYAKWIVNSYTVSFNSNGGSAVSSISVNHGSTINKPADPTRIGYAFSGWFKDSALSEPFTFGSNGDKITDNTTLYAKWTVNSYTVTFNSNGGSAVGSISVSHGSTIDKPADPTRTGYSFAGWFKDSALSAPFTFGSNGDKITDNTTLYAKWTVNSYTVSFNSNGGSAVDSISANYDSTIDKPTNPTRTGYSFAGWFKDSALSSPFTFGSAGDKITDNITLYAKWTLNTYTVTFNSNGGSAVSSISANHGSTIDKPDDPNKTGYSFAGWFKDSVLSSPFTFGNNGDTIIDNITLYAKWNLNSYTVTFNSNGGSAVDSILANYDSTIDKPTDPTRSGYSFSGWFKDSALSTPFSFGSNGDKITTDNITLYAKWTLNTYTVTFNSNGGSAVSSISANHGSTIDKPADPTRTGYSFSGWFKDSALSNSFTFGNNGDTIIDNTTLYAKWTLNSYTVTFNSNGGSAVDSVSASHGSTIDKPDDPTKTGYSFAGWFKDSALSSLFTFGSAGDKITDDTTLYAKWTVNSYTVSFNSNGGSAVDSISANYGSTIDKPTDPTRSGYSFSGWFKDSALSNQFTFGSGGDKITEDTTLHAKWTLISYTVSFNSNGGSKVQDVIVQEGGTVSTPSNPTRTGYVFAGWYKDLDFSEMFTFGVDGDKVTSDITLYARWLDIDVLTAEYALSEVVIGYAKGDNPKYVTQNLTLPTKSGSADISWSSSSNAISTNGSVTRQSGDVDVTLTARASYNGKTSEAKTFELRVIKKRTRDNSSITAIEIGDASSGDIEITRNASGDITDIEGQYVSFDIQNADDALDAVTVLREELGIRSPDKELEVSVVTSDAYGAEYQFQQVYKGVEVFGRGLIASVNAKGNGDFMHSDILPSSLLASLDMTNLISSSDAENAVKSSYSGEVSADAFGVVIYSLESHSEKPVYAYIVKSYSISGDEYLAKNVFVNAVTKEIIVTASTTNNASRSTVLTTGNDEKGIPTLFEVTLGYDGRYQMYEPKSKVKMYFGSLLNPIVNDRNSWDDLVYYIATIFPDPIRINENGQHISAYVNVTEIVNWWKEKFSRNSFDGKGMQVNVVVHGSSVGFPLVGKGNANWNSALDAMYIGDAKMNQYSCAVAKDVLAHESAHAVMRYCTSLAFMCNIDTVIGRRKSAICEGYADIFACLKDYYEYGENSSRIWTIGEDMYHGEGYIRNVANPSDPPDPDANKQGIGHLRDYNDAREYHLNGVLIPHTAYLMQRYGLSWERLGKVWYKSMSMGLPITSNFQDVRRCVVWAAQKLNVSDNEMTIIEAAFDEVGIEAQKENSASKVRISGTLANGTMKTAYTGTLTVSGGTAPYTWSKSSGTLPSGLKLTTANTKATISGTPTKAGTYTFNIRVTDANKATAVKSFVVRIAEASTSSNETSSETGSPSEKTSKESSKKTSDQERTKSPDENQNSLPENYYLLENSPELPEGENTDVNLRAELHVVSEDIVEAYEGKDSDLVKVKAGAPLRFTVTHWGTEVYDIVVYVDEKALDSIMVSDEGEFTLPSEIVHDDFKVGVKAESIIGKRESEEIYIIAE